MLVTFLIVNVVVVIAGFTVYYVATGTSLDDLGDKLTALADTDDVTPSVLLFLNLVLVLAIPVTWLVIRRLPRPQAALAGVGRAADPLDLAAGVVRHGVRLAGRRDHPGRAAPRG